MSPWSGPVIAWVTAPIRDSIIDGALARAAEGAAEPSWLPVIAAPVVLVSPIVDASDGMTSMCIARRPNPTAKTRTAAAAMLVGRPRSQRMAVQDTDERVRSWSRGEPDYDIL
jgi:hypothetical protein